MLGGGGAASLLKLILRPTSNEKAPHFHLCAIHSTQYNVLFMLVFVVHAKALCSFTQDPLVQGWHFYTFWAHRL